VLRNMLIIVYLVVGVVVASSHHHFTHLNSLTSVLSAVPAVLLWPLILFGVSLHIK
jgi:ABC-type anion transport system duplicated permease subunit